MYDSRIGRWLGPDPKGQFASPYEGMGNNPVSGFDKTGGLEEKPDGTPLYDPGDWHVSDRLNNTDLWKSANLYNLQNENYDQYFDFNQHSAYYKWANNLSQSEGHEVQWIGAAIKVAGDAAQEDDNSSTLFLSYTARQMGHDLNDAIFKGAMAPLKKLLIDNKNTPLKGMAAMQWDANMVWYEQADIAEGVFQKYSSNSNVISEWKNIASHNANSVLGWGAMVFGHIPPFTGDLANRIDRVQYGWSVMYPANVHLTILWAK